MIEGRLGTLRINLGESIHAPARPVVDLNALRWRTAQAEWMRLIYEGAQVQVQATQCLEDLANQYKEWLAEKWPTVFLPRPPKEP